MKDIIAESAPTVSSNERSMMLRALARESDICEWTHDHRWNACGLVRCLVCEAPLGPNMSHDA